MTNWSTKSQIIINTMKKVDESDQKSDVGTAISDKVYEVRLGLLVLADRQTHIDYCHVLVKS